MKEVMRGNRSYFLLFIIFICRVNLLHAQPGKRIIYADRNYRVVQKERDAAYIIHVSEKQDTVYFETDSRNPKGKIEAGKYPKNEGFDLRNCYLERYWPNGKIRSNGYLRQSWNEGVWKYYDETGKLYSIVNYREGMIDGRAERIFNNGLTRSYNYVKNLKEGESLLYDGTGNIYSICNYHNDSLHGPLLEYDLEGRKKRKAVYFHNIIKKDTTYYESGQVFNCENYDSAGLLHGRSMIFTPSGKIARYDEYSHGVVVQSNCIHPLAGADYESDDCPPRLREVEYPDGIEKYNEYVRLNQDYPEEAIKWKQQGVIVFTVYINDYGFVEEIVEENLIPLGYGLEAESLRLLGKMKRFNPKKLNGKSMPSSMRIPFVFILRE